MRKNLHHFLDKILTEGKRVSIDSIRIFNPKKVKFSIRNVFKCQFGCPMYNKRLSCPPFIPSYTEFKELFKSYRLGLLISFNLEVNNEKEFVLKKREIEEFLLISEKILLPQFHFAFSLFPGSCELCEVCEFEKSGECPKREKVRPSISGTGIDINSVHEINFKENALYSIILVF